MKETSWDDCLKTNSAVRVTPDIGKAKSLVETAKDRIKVSVGDINEKTANYIFEDYYSSISELIHALILLKGYKVSNHICLGNYLKNVLKREDLFRLFDDCRFKRNSLVYYGKRMDYETAKDSIEKAKKLFNELIELLNQQLYKEKALK